MKAATTLILSSMILIGCTTSDKQNCPVLFHCTFDSEEAIRHPDIGPDATVYTGVQFAPGVSGQAITVSRGTSIAYNFPSNYFGPKGCFIVRAKVISKDGYCHAGPCFFNLQQYNEKTREGPWCYLGYGTNNGEARSGYCGAVLNPRGATIPTFGPSFKYSATLGDNWQDWHEFRMSWNFTDETQKALVSLYVDNRLLARNYRTSFDLNVLINAWKNAPGCLAFGQSPFGHTSPDDFVIDEFTILNTDGTFGGTGARWHFKQSCLKQSC